MQVNNINKNNSSYKALPKKYKEVDKFLIRGPHPSIYDLFQLKKEGVNQIYDFRHKNLLGFKFIEKTICKLIGINYIRKPYSNLYGEYPNVQEFQELAQSVSVNGAQGGKTLFHCNSGRHRTAHMTAFYEITKGKHTLAEIKEELNENFGEKVDSVLTRQVLQQDYNSRSLKHYVGKNPIKRILTQINNRYAIAIKKGQKMFIDTIFNTK